MIDPLSDSSWKTEGKCYDLGITPKDVDVWESFFADSVRERQPAIRFCEGCPVQQRCLRFALETVQLWGVWGGRDESEIRRALWMNANGATGSRAKLPRCPNCFHEDSLDVVEGTNDEVECYRCDFYWRSETSAGGVKHYQSLSK